MKQAQVSLWIIIGVLMVLGVLVIVTQKQRIQDDTWIAANQDNSGTQLKAQRILDSCFEKAVKESVETHSYFGGLKPKQGSYALHLSSDLDNFPSFEKFMGTLSDEIKGRLTQCKFLIVQGSPGWLITSQYPTVALSASGSSTRASLNMPLRLKKGEQSVTISKSDYMITVPMEIIYTFLVEVHKSQKANYPLRDLVFLLDLTKKYNASFTFILDESENVVQHNFIFKDYTFNNQEYYTVYSVKYPKVKE